MFRVNEGNGQVGETLKTKREAFAELARSRETNGYAFVEFYSPGSADDPGDWFPLGSSFHGH